MGADERGLWWRSQALDVNCQARTRRSAGLRDTGGAKTVEEGKQTRKRRRQKARKKRVKDEKGMKTERENIVVTEKYEGERMAGMAVVGGRLQSVEAVEIYCK